MGFSWDRMYWFSIRLAVCSSRLFFKSIDCFFLVWFLWCSFLLFWCRLGAIVYIFYIPVCRFGMIIADVGKSFIVIFRNGGFESVVYLGIHSFGTIMKSDIKQYIER